MYYVPCAMCHLPCAMYHVPCTMYHVPRAMYHVSSTICHVPCTMYNVPCAICHVPCVMYHVPCVMYHVPCAMCHRPSRSSHQCHLVTGRRPDPLRHGTQTQPAHPSQILNVTEHRSSLKFSQINLSYSWFFISPLSCGIRICQNSPAARVERTAFHN